LIKEKIVYIPGVQFYHVTRPENIEAIEAKGLLGNSNNQIFAFTDLLVADCIAESQVFVDPYVEFHIQLAGITGDLWPDDVA